MVRPRHSLALALGAALVTGCPTQGVPFPADYESTWTEARTPCTLSHDHELTYIRVFANDLALGPYRDQTTRYPEGATLLKVEYEDEDCSTIRDYVIMQRLAPGEAPEDLEWAWERYDAIRRIVTDRRFEPDTCINCHLCHCGDAPYGWQLTCPEGAPEPPGGCI